MNGKRFSDEQIISILKEHEASAKMQDRIRKYNVSEQSVYRWKSKYAGMKVSEAKRLKELESENNNRQHDMMIFPLNRDGANSGERLI